MISKKSDNSKNRLLFRYLLISIMTGIITTPEKIIYRDVET